jgi:hypothetical protein
MLYKVSLSTEDVIYSRMRWEDIINEYTVSRTGRFKKLFVTKVTTGHDPEPFSAISHLRKVSA